MARKKTSAEKAREDAENEKVENMLDGAFGTLSGLETNKPEENIPEDTSSLDADVEVNEEDIQDSEKEEIISDDEEKENDENESAPIEEDAAPEKEDDGKALPSLPPSGPPSGPPSKGPPSGPPSDTPRDESSNEESGDLAESAILEEEPEGAKSEVEEETESDDSSTEKDETITEETEPEIVELEVKQEETESDDSSTEKDETITEEAGQEVVDEAMESSEEVSEEEISSEDAIEISEESENTELLESNIATDLETEAEIARLSAEVERLRRSMAGAAEVIEELETPPMPPAVMDNLVIGAHIIGDMARLARQLDREQLIRASMGTIAMLHPDQLEIIVSTKHMALLPRMDERDICAAKLGVDPPRGAPTDWRVLEVVLASVSLITGGPAAVIHSHGPFTTATSCEKDLVLVQPIDEIGKKHIGKIIIVDPDDDNPEEFLRQVAEALQQGGMRCVVIRGKGAYAVGADLDQAWANAAMLEHSMKIVLLARQANLKV